MNQNYFNLDNTTQAQSSSSNKNKKMARAALLCLLIVGMFGAVLYFSEPSNTYVVPNMLYMDAQNNNVVITSARNMTVCSSQGGDGIPDTHQQCTLYQSVQDIIAQNNGNNMINVYIAYKDINYTTEFNTTGNYFPDQSEYKPLLEDEVDLLFKATLTLEGTLLGLYAPKNHTYSELVIRLTERLVEQYFPQLSSSLYPSLRSFQLAAQPNQNIENSYLGTVTPNFSYDLIDDNHYVLQKEYCDEDFVNFQFSLGGDMPEISYQSNFTVKNGKVEVNKEVMTFRLNTQQKVHLRDNGSTPINPNNSTEYVELIGQSNSQISSTLEVLGSAQNPEFVAEVLSYEQSQGFDLIDLTQNSGKLEVLNGGAHQNSTVLTDATPIIQKSYDVFRHSIAGNEVTLTIDYKNFESYSDISSGIYLNGLRIFTLYQHNIEHPWFACAGFQKGDNRNEHLKIFEVVYPLLGGILNVPLAAAIQVDFGWNFNVGADGVNCNLEFKPYVTPSFEVTGAISVWKVAQGGVFARGNVANTYIDFLLQVNRQLLQLLFTVDAKLVPFEYHIGAFYQYITCSVKKMFQNFFKFKWGEICSMSDKHEVPLLDGQLLETLQYRIHQETKPILSA